MDANLYKTTIEIWTDYDPRQRAMEIDALAEQAMTGDAYCARQDTAEVLATELAQVAGPAADALADFFQVDDDGDSAAEAVQERARNTDAVGMVIPAEFRTDDGEFAFPFDALPYFEQASDADLIQLRDIGWAGDYPSDNVAYYMEDHSPAIAQALAYTARVDVGWEVVVQAQPAEAWVTAHRPALLGDAAEGDRS